MNQQPTSVVSTRNYHIDNIKGILILLVVCGHLLSTLQDMNSTFAIGVRTFIYFFHMPGFIFMSGYLAKGFLKKQYKGEKLLSYAWLYLLFKNAIDLVHLIFRRPYFNGGKHTAVLILIVCLFCFGIWLLSQLYDRFPAFQKAFILLVILYSLSKGNILTVGAAPWYLMALIWFHIFIYLTRNMKPSHVMAMAILISAFINYQDNVGKFLTISRAANFLPFFLMGFYINRETFERIVSHKKWKPILSIFFLLSALFITWQGRAIKKWLGVFFFGVSPYSKLLKLGNWYYHMAPLTCILWIAVTVLILFGLFAICPRGKSFLAKLGKNTIGIYVLHRLFKDFLIYGGFYDILSKNEYLAVAEVLLVSLLLAVVFGTDFWAKTLNKLNAINARWLYTEK